MFSFYLKTRNVRRPLARGGPEGSQGRQSSQIRRQLVRPSSFVLKHELAFCAKLSDKSQGICSPKNVCFRGDPEGYFKKCDVA